MLLLFTGRRRFTRIDVAGYADSGRKKHEVNKPISLERGEKLLAKEPIVIEQFANEVVVSASDFIDDDELAIIHLMMEL